MSRNMQASRAQLRASDPSATAWVNANAGSGKTHVLVDRVIRLLLTGTEPSRIMCLTFTKAAAAGSTAVHHRANRNSFARRTGASGASVCISAA